MEIITRHCFLIDDDDDDQLIFETTVKKYFSDYKFKGFFDFESAEKYLDSKTLGDELIVFLDLNMPKVNGIEALEKLRNKKETANLKIVIYSTSNNPNDVKTSLNKGADAFITKPSKIEDLVEELKPYLS